MGFETRKSGRSYMYLGVRDPVTQKVRKLYLGNGAQAQAAAVAISERRDRRDAESKAVRTAKAATLLTDGMTQQLNEVVMTLMEAVLTIEGWHRPNYGPWRRKNHAHKRDKPDPAVGHTA